MLCTLYANIYSRCMLLLTHKRWRAEVNTYDVDFFVIQNFQALGNTHIACKLFISLQNRRPNTYTGGHLYFPVQQVQAQYGPLQCHICVATTSRYTRTSIVGSLYKVAKARLYVPEATINTCPYMYICTTLLSSRMLPPICRDTTSLRTCRDCTSRDPCVETAQSPYACKWGEMALLRLIIFVY